MPSFDAISKNELLNLNVNAVKTADEDGDSVDNRGFNSVLHFITLGVSGDTLSGSVLAELKLEESDDDSTFIPVTNSDDVNINTNSSDGVVVNPDSNGIFATINDPAEDDLVYAIGYRGTKRYSRVVYDITGTHTNGMPMSNQAIRSRPDVAPI